MTSSNLEIRMEGAVGVVPQGTAVLPAHAFKNRTEMVSVSLPASLRSIQEGAFEGCTGLLSVTLPPNLTTIADYAFSGCSSLLAVHVNKSLQNVGYRVFDGCSSLLRFKAEPDGRFSSPGGALFDKQTSTLVRYPADAAHGRVRLGMPVERFADGAFEGCADMTSLTFRGYFCEAGHLAFEGCDSLGLINDNPFLLSRRGTVAYVSPNPPNGLVCLHDVDTVADYAFTFCTGLKTLVLPTTLNEVGPSAFAGANPGPSLLCLENGFSCPLPLVLQDELGAVIRPEVSGGWMYNLGPGGRYIVGRKFTSSTSRWTSDYCEVFPELLDIDEDEEDMDEDEEDIDEYFEGPGMFPGEAEFSGKGKFAPVDVEDCCLDDVVGMEDLKTEIRRNILLPAQHPELFEKFRMKTDKGILMYGPPGTGKSLAARAVAGEMDAAFFSVKASDIMDRWVGSEEANIRNLFKAARSHETAVIFIDDADALMKHRGNEAEPWCDRAVAQLLVEIQGMERHDGTLILLASCNRPWDIDSALTRSGRFGTHIHVGLPDERARQQIFAKKIGDAPCSPDVDTALLASRTGGYSGADVEEVVNHAKMHRIVLTADGEGGGVLTPEDFEAALSEVHSTVSEKDLRDIENYRRTGLGPDCGNGQYIPGREKSNGTPDAGYM